jgi:hypothetical protein
MFISKSNFEFLSYATCPPKITNKDHNKGVKWVHNSNKMGTNRDANHFWRVREERL